MSDEQSPREIVAKLAAMSDREFSQFMAEHFAKLCSQPLPNAPALKTASGTSEK